MSVDLSRVTKDRTKHYARVIFEQGRPHVDADLNEQQEIVEFRSDTEGRDVIGQAGAPKDGGGFRISELGSNNPDIAIMPGRMYLDGILAELTPTWVNATVLSTTQVQVPHAIEDGIAWAANQWVEVKVPGQIFQITSVAGRVLTLASTNLTDAQVLIRRLTTLGLQPDLPGGALPTGQGRYRVFLDVWDQQITWIQDPPMREIALGGVDTAGRARVRAQVRVEPSGQPNQGGKFASSDCATYFAPGWAPQGSSLSGMALIRVDPQSANQGECVLPPLAGFRGLESQLYRIQVDHGGDTAKDSPTFKWSRENASVVTAIEDYTSNQATVHDTGRDDVLGFKNGDSVEVSDDTSDLSNTPHPLQSITDVKPAIRQITLGSAYPAVDKTRHPKIQRWDGQGSIDPNAGWIPIEAGLQVQFVAGTYRSGDYWLIPARTATGSDPGTIEWPTDDADNPIAQPPHGITHHYAPLGLADFDGTNFVGVQDCRALFPPLTHITAKDVTIDGVICNFPADATVQEALAQLCAQVDGVCTVTAVPGPGWESVFDELKAKTDARVCMPVGLYPLADRKVVTNLGNILIEGSGPGTLIQSQGEAALLLERCASVQVRDLSISAAKVDTGKIPPAGGLHGALTLVDCGDVVVERVRASCGAQTYRGSSCINVGYTQPSSSPLLVRIRDCDVAPGHQQVGILVTGGDRVFIEDCTVQAGAALPGGQSLYNDLAFRHAVLPTLFQGAFIGKVGKKALALERMAIPTGRTSAATMPRGVQHGNSTSVSAGNVSITFRAPGTLAQAWQPLIQSLQPQVASPNQLLKFVKSTAQRLMTDTEFRAQHVVFNNWLNSIANNLPATASQGIVVGGTKTGVVRIVNNTVNRVMEGINVGLSAGEGKGSPTLSAGPVLISGNTVNVFLSPDATRSRHGIFVGNNASLVIEDNYITVAKSPTNQAPVDGIRVWGYLGRLMAVRQNHVVGANVGVRVVPVGTDPSSMRWIVGDNMLEGGLQVPPKVVTSIAGVALNAN